MPVLEIWKPLMAPCVHVNFDVVFYNNMQASSVGVVVRNHLGLLMGAACYWHENVPSIVVTEALATLKVVRFARDLGFNSIEVEGDLSIVIAKLHNSVVDRSEVSSYIWDVKQLALMFEHVKFQHIERGGNKVAHLLAWDGFLQKRDLSWIEDGPALIQVDQLRDARTAQDLPSFA